MPNSVTMARARRVARSMSSAAPVVTSPSTTSSAVRPASVTASRSDSSDRLCSVRSSSGRRTVWPSAAPRATIDTLCTSSAPGRTWLTSAWPASWTATVRRSRSDMTRPRRSGPARTRSTASAELRLTDAVLPAARRQQRRLVEDVGQVGAREAGGAAGEHGEVNAGVQGLVPGVDLQDGDAAAHVGGVHDHATVEPPGPQQRRVQDVHPVGGGQQHDALGGVEAVELHQELVQGLLALVVGTAQPRAAAAADGVELVDEHDGRGVGVRLLEQVPHPAGAHAGEHLDEVGPGDAEERHVGLAGHGPGQQRLAGARRPHQQHPPGHPGAQAGEPPRIAEELDHLPELLHRFVGTGDVGEGDALLAVLDELASARPNFMARPPPCICMTNEMNTPMMRNVGRMPEDQLPRGSGALAVVRLRLHVVVREQLGGEAFAVGLREGGPGQVVPSVSRPPR